MISSAKAQVDPKELKVIVGNPTIINAFKAGFPGDGKSFPDGSRIAKLQWKPKKSTEAPFDVQAVGGATRSSTTTRRPTSSRPMLLPRTVDTRAIRP